MICYIIYLGLGPHPERALGHRISCPPLGPAMFEPKRRRAAAVATWERGRGKQLGHGLDAKRERERK